jgi:phage shock protein E
MNKWIWIVLVAGVVLALKSLLVGCVSKETIRAKLSDGALVVDVRTPAEFSRGHYEGALNIPLNELADRIDRFGTDKNRPIVLYCRSGSRAAAARRTLEKAGFTNVINAGSLGRMPR